MNAIAGSTVLLITTGYELKVADSLATNFHQPNSKLLLLAAAVICEDWMCIYSHDYRFLNFGDASLLEKK